MLWESNAVFPALCEMKLFIVGVVLNIFLRLHPHMVENKNEIFCALEIYMSVGSDTAFIVCNLCGEIKFADNS